MKENSEQNMASLNEKRESWDVASADYIRNLAAMLYLRGLNHTEHFFIATNLPGAGVFSDNIFVFMENEDVIACFIRQRDQQGDFHKVSDHLLKYFISFKEILQSLPWLEQQFGADITHIEVVHYTDHKMDPRHSVSHPDHILDSGGLILNLYSSEYPLEFFDELEMYSNFLETFSLMNTGNNNVHIVEDIMSEITSKELREKLEILKSNPTKSEARKLSLEIEGLVNKTQFKTFLSKLKVLHSQASSTEMEDVAKDEFLKLLGGNREFLKNMDGIFNDFLKSVEEWMEKRDYFLTEDTEIWKEVMIKMSRILSEPMVKKISEFGVQFSVESLEDLRRCMEENSVLSVISDCDDTFLSALKIHQILLLENHILTDLNSLLEHPCEVLRAWASAWCLVLVIQSKEVSIAEARLVCSGISTIMQSQDSQKLILVSQRGNTVARTFIQEIGAEFWEHVDSTILTDFSPKSQATFLSRCVEFQGVLTNLSTVVHPYPELLDRIRGNLLVSLLKSNSPLVIGHELPPVIDDYFPRTLSRCTKLSRKVFDHVNENTVLAICGSSPEELSGLLPFGEEPSQFDPILQKESMLCDSSFVTISDSIEEDILKDLLDEEFTDLHCVQVTKGEIEWKWSKGDSRYIKEFLIPTKLNYVKCELATDISEKVVLVVGDAGVGKTTFLNALARQTKEAYPSTWVAKINLALWTDYISNTLFDSQNKVITFLEHVIGITESKTATLDKLMFTQSLYRCGNIVIFVDGFEYTPSYLVDKIAFLLKLLLENKIEGMYITCGPDVVDELQENFYNLPYTLMPLMSDDQKTFLINKWSKKLKDVVGLEAFVGEVLSTTERSLGEMEMKLSSLPDLTVMMAETFQDDLNTYITTGVMTLSSQLNLIRIYDKFVERMCLRLLKAKRRSYILEQQLLIENKLSLCDKYRTISAMITLSSVDEACLDINSLHYKYNMEIVDMRSLSECSGSLIHISNGNPSFRYRTLVEYFAASWLVEEFMLIREFLQNQFLAQKFQTLRKWFDLILCKDNELHISVLNADIAKMNALFEKGVDVNKRDHGGRTPLHLASMYDMVGAIRILIRQGADVEILDNILKWSPLRYADQLGAWGAIDELLGSRHSNTDLRCTIETMKNESLANKVLALACQEGYIELIDFLFSHSLDVRQVIDFDGSTPLHLASKYGHTDLVQYLVQLEAEITKYGKNCRNILQYLNMSCSSISGRLLRNSRANLNVTTNDGSTPLMFAASEGHTDTAKILIQQGAAITISKLDGSSALHLAAESGHKQTVKFLIDSGADVNKEDNEGSTPLIVAAKSGCTKIIFYLLQNGADVNSVDHEGNSALHFCAGCGDVDSIHWLLKAGAHTDVQNSEQSTALHLAAKGGHVDCAKCLIEAGADAEALNCDDATAVHLAAKMNSVPTLICISAAGANIDVKNTENSTPLHWACHKGHKAAVKCLLELGAKKDEVNNKGYTPLHVAVSEGHSGAVKCLIDSGVEVAQEVSKWSPLLHIASRKGYTDVLRQLIEAKSDVNMSDTTGATSLHCASWGGHEDVVELLLRSGADTRLLDNNGSSPLHWAAGEGKSEIVRALINAGASVDILNKDGDSPLHWAAKEGHVETAQVLVEAGADFSKVNADGSTPMHLAMLQPHTEMIDYLTQCELDVAC